MANTSTCTRDGLAFELWFEDLHKDNTIATAALKPQDLKAPLRECGYRRDLLRSDVEYADGVSAPLVGFAQFPADTRTACIAVLAADRDPRQLVEQSRPLGTPLVFVCFENSLQWWKQGSHSAEWIRSFERHEVEPFIRKNQDRFNPDAIYRAKTWGRFRSEYQLEFVDLGLMPLLEEEVGTALGKLIERNVNSLKGRLGWSDVSSEQGHWLIQTVFWLVSGKILRDKNVEAFEGLNIHDVESVFSKVAKHYGSQPIAVGSKKKLAALEESARTIEQFASLELTTTEALAHVYENALISKATRSSLGTHSTPAYLVDYIVGNLAEWIAEIPENDRSVFEPACGHAAFLVSAMRLLSELLPPEKSIPSRRGPYLRSRLHGTDIDSFALELARLSLTLTDIPNPDGWDLRLADMFLGDELSSQASKNTVLLANPPFDNFSPDKQKHYRDNDSEVAHFNKAAEMLARMLPQLPAGGVFGFVLPQTFLHSDNASPIREFFVRNCELQEICLFPDKVFSFSDAESAIILGRRKQPKNSRLHYRRVRERDVDDFRTKYESTTSAHVTQTEFASGDDSFSLRVPDLQDVWSALADNARLSDFAELGQGLVYHGKDLPPNSTTYSDTRFASGQQGFVVFDRGLKLHELPTAYWLNLDSSVIRRPQSGTTTGTPQVLLNYARVSRGPWRLKALIDHKGHPVTSRFVPVRPTNDKYSLEVLWAVLNSPVANAFAFSHLSKRDNIVGDIRRIPLPKSTAFEALSKAANRYLESARSDTDSETLQALLADVDCAVLKLYQLPVKLERALLDLFSDYERVGVSFNQSRYFPSGFDHPIRLADFRSLERDWPKTNRERGKLIDKDIEGAITDEEQARLTTLQAYADYYLEKTTPRPTDVLDHIEDHVFRGSVKKEPTD